MKKCIDQLLPIITEIINSSMSSGCFPDELKSAIIRQHLKKTNTDTDELKNYRPVSNRHFISKVLEKFVVKRLEEHIINHNLYDPLQSAYRVAHSTETAIMKIHNDIMNGIDQGSGTCGSRARCGSFDDCISFKISLKIYYMALAKIYSKYFAFMAL